MKKQGYNSRLDESLGARHGKKSQSMKDEEMKAKRCLKKCTVMHMVLTKEWSTEVIIYWKTHKHLK